MPICISFFGRRGETGSNIIRESFQFSVKIVELEVFTKMADLLKLLLIIINSILCV